MTVEIVDSDGTCRLCMTRIICSDSAQSRYRFGFIGETQQTHTIRQESGPAGILRDDRAPRCKVAGGPARKPSGSSLHVRLFGNGKFATRGLNESAVGVPVWRTNLRIQHTPSFAASGLFWKWQREVPSSPDSHG